MNMPAAKAEKPAAAGAWKVSSKRITATHNGTENSELSMQWPNNSGKAAYIAPQKRAGKNPYFLLTNKYRIATVNNPKKTP